MNLRTFLPDGASIALLLGKKVLRLTMPTKGNLKLLKNCQKLPGRNFYKKMKYINILLWNKCHTLEALGDTFRTVEV
jgi:hypothetical protein